MQQRRIFIAVLFAMVSFATPSMAEHDGNATTAEVESADRTLVLNEFQRLWSINKHCPWSIPRGQRPAVPGLGGLPPHCRGCAGAHDPQNGPPAHVGGCIRPSAPNPVSARTSSTTTGRPPSMTTRTTDYNRRGEMFLPERTVALPKTEGILLSDRSERSVIPLTNPPEFTA